MDARTEAEPTAMKNPTVVERKSERELDTEVVWPVPALCEMDVRVGGGYRLVFRIDAAKTMTFFGRYLDVTPHSRLVWTNDEGGDAGPITTVTFEDKGGKTLLVMHELHPSKEALDAALASGSYDGMRETLEQLDELLVTLGATAAGS